MTCQARQYSDQMMCGACGLQWDVNDPEPPECLTLATTGRMPAGAAAQPHSIPKPAATATRFRDRTDGRFRVVLADRETGIQGVGYGETVTDATADAGRDMAKRSVGNV